jgi:hypothetical protein
MNQSHTLPYATLCDRYLYIDRSAQFGTTLLQAVLDSGYSVR